jgi:hypothetical protein
VFGTTTPQFTGGQTAEFRLQPTLTASISGEVLVPVILEDCLPAGQTFLPDASTPAASMVQPDAPADAGLTCGAGQTYVRWDLGPVQVNALIPPITYSVRVSSTADAGTQVNTAMVTAEGDGSPPEARQAVATIQIVQPAGVVIDKTTLTPLIEVNRPGEINEDPLRWRLELVNINTNPGPSDVDIIDRLPRQGVNGTAFGGTLAFDGATVVAGDLPGQAVQILYTRRATVDVDAGNTTNHPTTGSTVWCSLAGTTFTRVLGNGTNAACPSTLAEVTGLRIRRPGAFGSGEKITVDLAMTPSANAAGDRYVNEVAARAQGLDLLVGPALAPATVVASSIGDLVWEDRNLNGIQDEGEPPIAGFEVTLDGTDTDGNPVGPLTTVTDAEGRYRFEGLQSGDYTVTFQPSSLAANQHFTLQDQGANDLVDSDGDPVTGIAQVRLGANVANLSVDQGVFTAAPGIDVVKSIEGDDANDAPGVLVEPGEPMTVTFEVTNTGNMTLDPVVVADDTIPSEAISCPETILGPGATMTCTAAFPGPDAGTQHTNVATASGVPVPLPDGTQREPVTADDAANAFGIVRQVDITKDLVGEPVPNGDGTYTVTYDLVVTNRGTQAATYDLDDHLQFGAGATVTSAQIASGPAGVSVNAAWDGASDARIATGVVVPLAGTHTYRVRAVAAVDPTAAIGGSADCELTDGEAGTGFLNGATLTFDGAETDVEACAGFPVTTFDKTLVGPPNANGDGTYTIDYDIVVTNTGGSGDRYDLADELRFGANIEIQSAAVTNTEPGTIAVDDRWNGVRNLGIVANQSIAAGASHSYRIRVVATVGSAISLEESDCTLQGGEAGTGFLNGATLTVNGIERDDDACAPAPNTSVAKVLFGPPVVEDGDTVTTRYLITVSNSGAGDDRYGLDDELRFGEGITVNTAEVANIEPGGITTDPEWNGTTETGVVGDVPIGAGEAHTYVVTVNATIGASTSITDADCTLEANEDGTGFMNAAILAVNGQTAEAEACGEVDPVVAIDKALVGAPVRQADGSWVVSYDVVVSNRVAPNRYDLEDRLVFGGGIEVVGAVVSNTGPGGIETRESWDGVGDLRIVSGEAIGAGVSHTYRVEATALVPASAGVRETDCSLGDGEVGTGFLNRARVSTENQDLSDEACAAASNVSIEKALVGELVVEDDNSVTSTYAVSVSNAGAGGDVYDLDDALLFGEGISVNSASVANLVPGDVVVDPAWDGLAEQRVASGVEIGGSSGEPVVHTYVVTVNATIGAQHLDHRRGLRPRRRTRPGPGS